ncbi:uncharacterized protein C19orf44 homolog isoform X2 [Toxotes jaculatrix]|uniref:uncharacterized protein C19orf44 homolog isoform X2 n=1 Tax=Toxotes jaculatrix TaxID=941984 RepID=UPI001B3AB1F6|nr:uncharacterized protein C19orf44 homolog isoform X2 [Toxotes jaculatrix]
MYMGFGLFLLCACALVFFPSASCGRFLLFRVERRGFLLAGGRHTCTSFPIITLFKPEQGFTSMLDCLPSVGAVGGLTKTRSAPPNTQTLLSDLSDLSSLSSASENGADAVHVAGPEKSQGREGGPTKDLRPQSSLGGGGGSRFLKKAPPPPTNSSQSPVSKSQRHQMPETRYVSSSQTAALSRLAQIESRIRSYKQAKEQARQGISPPPEAAAQSLESSLPVPVSAQSSSDQGLKGKRFLKNKAVVAVDSTNVADAGSPGGPDVGVRSKSRAAGTVFPLVSLEKKSLRVVSAVSLESDEEDMKKLLGDSLDSTDNSLSRPERPSSTRTDKKLNKSSQKVHSTPPPAAVCPLSPSNTAPPRSPASPSRRSSPFRFTGQAQAHFSPSVLSPSPSPPHVSSSLVRRPNFPHRAGSPQRSLSSISGHSEVRSLEELFPEGSDSEGPCSEMNSVSSEDFKINVMTLDDLVPATFGFTEEPSGKEGEAKHSAPVPGSLNGHQQPQREEKEEEVVLNYQSDFESESKTESNDSASQVSELLQGDGNEADVREEASDSDLSCKRTEDDYSSTFSDTASQTSDCSHTLKSFSRSSDSRSSVSYDRRTSRRRTSGKVLKDAAVQTQPDTTAYTWSTGLGTFEPKLDMSYLNPIPLAAHALSAEAVEALSTFNPAVFVLNEMLKQQLATTRRFIESSRHLHSSLVQSLEPPNYRYTTLEDTRQYIRQHRPPKLTMEEALEEVRQEMREYHCT